MDWTLNLPRALLRTFVPLLACTLVSCGGGGGYGGDDDAPPPPPPVVPLTLVSSTPAPQAVDVRRADSVLLTFSSPLDATTVNASTVSLRTPTTDQAITLNVDGATLILTPASSLAPHMLYTVRVETGVRNTSGVALASPVVLSFTTDAFQSQAARLLENNDVGDAQLPRIAMNAQGNAFATWMQADNRSGHIPVRGTIAVARYSAQDKTWGAARDIGVEPHDFIADPYIALDAVGNAVVVWSQGFLGSSIWANRYRAAENAWGAAEEVSVEAIPNGEFANTARVVLDSNGNAHVFYLAPQARARLGTPDGNWGVPIPLDGVTPGFLLDTAVEAVADGNGNVLAAWAYHSPPPLPGYTIAYSRYRPGSGWSEPKNVVQDPIATFNQNLLRIACNANGDAAIVWSTLDGTRTEVLASRYTIADDAWGPAQNLEDSAETLAGHPGVAIDAQGNLAVVWHQKRGTQIGLGSNRYSVATGRWGTAQLIDTTAGEIFNPSVQFDRDGNRVAVWEYTATPGGRFTLHAAHAASSSDAWSEPRTFVADGSDEAFDPQIVIAPSSEALVIWQQRNSENFSNIWTNTFQ